LVFVYLFEDHKKSTIEVIESKPPEILTCWLRL